MSTRLDVAAQAARPAPRTVPVAAAAIVAAGLSAVYGVYGDPHPTASQKGGAPFVVGAAVVIGALVFGLLVPWAARTAARASGWGLALSLVGLVAIPISFWSGLPVIIGGAGVLLGLHARRAATAAGRSTGLATSATVVGGLAIVVSTLLLVLGNTVLA